MKNQGSKQGAKDESQAWKAIAMFLKAKPKPVELGNRNMLVKYLVAKCFETDLDQRRGKL